MKKHNLGIIGAGMYGKVLIQYFQQDKRANIIWVNSASEATTRSAAEEFGVEKWSTDFRDVLADPAVDAVVIATPPYLHADQLEAAIAARKHVLLEKPIAESRESLERIVKAVEAASGLPGFAAGPARAAEAEAGFTSMFNGKDLTGWEGKEGWWYVEDGTITSQSTPEKPCLKCNYLIWQGGKPGDFELRLKYRIVGGNSCIQFRSQMRPDWDTYGYQADIDAAGQWAGALFEHARGGIAMRGQRVVVDENGKKQVTSLGDSAELMKHIKKDDWNEYCFTARGSEITLAINGAVMSQAVDHEKGKAARDGIIGLQVHPGPPMKIQFKDLRIKMLGRAKP